MLMVRDLELVKAIMIKDFDHFTDKIPPNNKNPSFVNKMLINLKVGNTLNNWINMITLKCVNHSKN